MIPTQTNTAFTTTGTVQSSFGIDTSQVAHLMRILRSSLYSRKGLAVIREYFSNAWDEHNTAGIPDRPVHVHIPTSFEPYFEVRDFGRGLSQDEVLHLYTQYAASSKRNDNSVVGSLGVGCKVGFAIGTSFTVTSWHDGFKQVYGAALDEEDIGKMTLLHVEECGDETGVLVKVPVPTGMVREFQTEAAEFFRYVTPRPEINITIPDLPKPYPHGYAEQSWAGNAIALMGCIPYRIELPRIFPDGNPILGHLRKYTAVVSVPIGSVSFAASRESLEYTARTENALRSAFSDLYEDILEELLRSVRDSDLPTWERRMLARESLRHFLRDMPEDLTWLMATSVRVWDPNQEQVPFNIWLLGHLTTELSVMSDQQLWVLTGPRKGVRQFSSRRRFPMLVPREGFTPDDVLAWWDQNSRRLGLDGLPVKQEIIQLDEKPADQGQSSTRNPKYSQSVFLWKGDKLGKSKSEHWEISAPPTGEHLYVPIHRFKMMGADLGGANSPPSFMGDLYEILISLKRNIPPIYGYKPDVLDEVPESGTLLWDWLHGQIPWVKKAAERLDRIAQDSLLKHQYTTEFLRGIAYWVPQTHPLFVEVRFALKCRNFVEGRHIFFQKLQRNFPVESGYKARILRFLTEAYPLHNNRNVLQLWRSSQALAENLDKQMAMLREQHPEALEILKEIQIAF